MAVRSPATKALFTLLKNLQLRPVKKIGFSFDPFHENVTSLREFLFHINSPKILDTNPKCSVKSTVVCNRSEPLINLELENGLKFRFNTENLTTLEIAQEFDRIVTIHDKKPEEIIVAVQQKKASKGKGKPGKR